MLKINNNKRVINQKHMILIFFCIYSTLSINQKCTYTVSQTQDNQTNKITETNQCPKNSFCSSNGYCVCNQGYFGNCQVEGEYLNITTTNYTLTQSMTYFIIKPTINQYVYYKFQFCNLQSLSNNQILNLWSDDGGMIQPTQNNALGNNKILNGSQGCIQLMTPFFVFQSQANGQQQLLILGARLQQNGSLNITLQVQQSLVFGFQILYKIIMILISAVGFVSICSVIYCIYKCKRRGYNITNQQNNKNNIQFFDQYMPANKVKLNQIKEQICAVCLIQYQENQQIRETICGHNFHKTCLDQWCVTHLNCPICRTSFEKANLIEVQYMKLSRNTSATNDQQMMIDFHNQNMNQSIVQDYMIDNQVNLRKPII